MSVPAGTIRVLVVTNMYPSPASPSRGIFVKSQVEALQRTGEVDVEVVAFDAARRPWRYMTSLVEQALRRRDADLVHAHYGLSGPAALAAAGRRPVVLTVHGRDCHHPVVKRITAQVARRADAVVAVSRELAGICPFPTADVIPIGVDLHRFEPVDRAEARRRLDLPENERFILFPADPVRPEKRYDRAEALAEAVPEVRLRTLGGIPSSDVSFWYNAADAVVIPSDREGYGLACVETLACNVPVLSTPVGIAREILPRVPGTLCARFDVEVWAAHLRRLLQDGDPHVEGRQAVQDQSTDAMAQRTLALYREILRRRSA